MYCRNYARTVSCPLQRSLLYCILIWESSLSEVPLYTRSQTSCKVQYEEIQQNHLPCFHDVCGKPTLVLELFSDKDLCLFLSNNMQLFFLVFTKTKNTCMIGHVSMQIHTNGLVDRSFYINFILVKYPVKLPSYTTPLLVLAKIIIVCI